jgi:hypothetical protein
VSERRQDGRLSDVTESDDRVSNRAISFFPSHGSTGAPNGAALFGFLSRAAFGLGLDANAMDINHFAAEPAGKRQKNEADERQRNR